MSGIYADPNTKYVGIGTTAPLQKLHLVGDALVSGHVLPGDCNVYNLGSADSRWKDLYLSGNTIDLGGTFLKRDEESGGIKIQSESGESVDTNVRNLNASGYVDVAGTRLARHVTGPLMVHTAAGEMESGMFKHVYVDGTVRASNMEIIGDFVRLNTVTSNTEQVVVENAGTGPALKVTQTGVNSIAEFYDDGGVLALKIADGGNVGIGTSNPSAKLDVIGNIHLTGSIYKNGEVFNSSVGDSIPIGTIMPFYSTTVSDPSYLICNGGTYNRVDYIELANVLGVSPTATTFQVPDLRDKFLKGKNADAVGATGGSATKTLVEANMPAHSHGGTTATNGAHMHNLKTEFGLWGATGATTYSAPNAQYNQVSYVNSYINTVSVVSNGDHAHTFTTDTKGSGTAFDILPPYTTVIYIIKAKNNQYVTPIRDGDYWTNVSNKLFYQSGNVGIGTTNPQQLLDVNGNIHVQGAIQSQSQFLGKSGDSVTAPAFSWAGDTNVGIYRPSADTLGMVTNGVERMRVDANGNVGIGTANPLAKLHVQGSIRLQNSFEVSDLTNFYTDIKQNIYYDNGWKSLNGGAGSLLVMSGGTSDDSSIAMRVFNHPKTTAANSILTQIEAFRVVMDGNIQTPLQSGFFLQLYNGASYNALAAGGVMYKDGTIRHNIGSNFNLSTGTYTAPYNGRYMVMTSILIEAGYGRLEFNITAGTFTTASNGTGTTYDTPTTTFVVLLSANNQIYCTKGHGTAHPYSRTDNFFGVYYLG